MIDETETLRRAMVAAAQDKIMRDVLEFSYGQVWNTAELTTEFDVRGFAAPFVVVTRRSDGKRGSLMFQHSPRFYYNFTEYLP